MSLKKRGRFQRGLQTDMGAQTKVCVRACVRVYDNENESPKAGNNFYHKIKTAAPIRPTVYVCVLGRVQIHASTAMIFSIIIASLHVNPILRG